MSVRTRLKDVARRILALAVKRRLRDLDPAQRLALFNLDTTRVDETVIFTCSYVTRQQLVAMADRVRRETRAVRRLRFGKRWVTLLDADVLGSSHVEIIMTALAAAGARIVLHPSVCRAVSPELRPGDLCLIAEADGRDDPVCRAIAAPSVIPADPELLERMAQGLKGMANGGGMRVHRVRTRTLPVFVNLDHERLRWIPGEAQIIDLEVAAIYAMAARFGLRTLSVKLVTDNVLHGPDMFTSNDIDLADLLAKGEVFLQAMVNTLIRSHSG